MIGSIASLRDAADAGIFGGKAASLARALAKELPVPPGVALSADAVRALDQGHRPTLGALRVAYRALGGLVAVRSSAVGEDSSEASFAGQHLTQLGVIGETDVLAAIFAVHHSGFSEDAARYRRLLGGAGEDIRVGVVVQRQLDPRAAGVLFTRNPVSGADERVAEAAFGLGEVVVASLVTPDFFRFARGAAVAESRAGIKPLSLHPLPGGGVERRGIPQSRVHALCLEPGDIAQLDRLADLCEGAYQGPQDIEWAFVDDMLYLLQSRPITTAMAG